MTAQTGRIKQEGRIVIRNQSCSGLIKPVGMEAGEIIALIKKRRDDFMDRQAI
jgi:hypothetical protein